MPFMAQIGGVRVGTDDGMSEGVFQDEYLPASFSNVSMVIHDLSIKIIDPLQAVVTVYFTPTNTSNFQSDLYEGQKWKRDRSLLIASKTDFSPNLSFFSGSGISVPSESDITLEAQNQPIRFSSMDQFWNILMPDSLPSKRFKKFRFFSGLGRMICWKLLNVKHVLNILVRRNSESDAYEFGLFFPFKQISINMYNLVVDTNNQISIDRAYLKRASCLETHRPNFKAGNQFDFNDFKWAYTLSGMGKYRIENVKATQTLDITDFETLVFQFYPSKNKTVAKNELFNLKDDLAFRMEVGQSEYEALIKRARELPEKCRPSVTMEFCQDCTTKINNLCVVNTIALACNLGVLAHNGLEYADLLLKDVKTNYLYPILAKGPRHLTYGSDGGIFKQVIQKLSDNKINGVIIALSGTITNNLLVELERQASIAKKSLIILSERDLAQFIYRISKVKTEN